MEKSSSETWDLIRGQIDELAKVAGNHLRGHLSASVEEFKDRLRPLIADIELGIEQAARGEGRYLDD